MNRLRMAEAGVLAVLVLAGGGSVMAPTAASAATREGRRLSGVSAWARVSASGSLLGGEGITSVNKFGGGRYNLFTTDSVDGCALLGTINTVGGTDPGPGSSSILVGEVGPHTLFVRTATPSTPGNASVDDDRAFSVEVFC